MANLRATASLSALLILVVSAASLVGQQAPIGYDDTPMQPDGIWRVHDIRRPRPPVVTPGLSRHSAAQRCNSSARAGDNLSSWQATDGSAASWLMSGGVLRPGRESFEPS